MSVSAAPSGSNLTCLGDGLDVFENARSAHAAKAHRFIVRGLSAGEPQGLRASTSAERTSRNLVLAGFPPQGDDDWALLLFGFARWPPSVPHFPRSHGQLLADVKGLAALSSIVERPAGRSGGRPRQDGRQWLRKRLPAGGYADGVPSSAPRRAWSPIALQPIRLDERRWSASVGRGRGGPVSPFRGVLRPARQASPMARPPWRSAWPSPVSSRRPKSAGWRRCWRRPGAVRAAMASAAIHQRGRCPSRAQIKCPLLTQHKLNLAHGRGPRRRHRRYLRLDGIPSCGASALGVALALEEIEEAALSDAAVCREFGLWSGRAMRLGGKRAGSQRDHRARQ